MIMAKLVAGVDLYAVGSTPAGPGPSFEELQVRSLQWTILLSMNRAFVQNCPASSFCSFRSRMSCESLPPMKAKMIHMQIHP